MKALDRLLKITRSLDFEENGRMRLIAGFWAGAKLRLHFEVNDGNDHHTMWELTFSNVLEERLAGAYYCGLNVWHEGHPATDQYTEQRVTVSFSCAPPDPDRLIGQLWVAHRALVDDWIPFDRYFNDAMPLRRLLAANSGILAAGPRFIMNEYARVLKENGCIPNKSRRSAKGRITKASLIHFDESFVIAEAVVAKRLAG
jgi:hypothetical protein